MTAFSRLYRSEVMIDIEMTFEDAAVRRLSAATPLVIGRAAHCGLRIVNWRGGRQHARLSRDEAEQLFTLRHLVEDELLKTVEWPDAELLHALSKRAERLEELLDQGDRSNWWNAHHDFHMEIFNLSPKKTIVREAMRLWALTDRYRALLPLPRRASEERKVVNKHELVEALKEQDRANLLAVRRNRRESFERLLLETLEARGL